MNAEFTGEVLNVIEKSGTKKDGTPFNAWAVVVKEVEVQYPDSMVADFFGDKPITKPNVGDMVTVHYHLRASEYNGKWYGQNNIWKIDLLESAPKAGSGEAPQQAPADPLAAAPNPNPPEGVNTDPKSGLPF
jgi:hypothetical protein